MAAGAASLSWQHYPMSTHSGLTKISPLISSLHLRTRHVAVTVRAFKQSDFDRFSKRVASGKAWRDAWEFTSENFEQLVFDAKKTAERLDRRYSISRRVDSAAQSASERARELDRKFEVSNRWRTFSVDFSRNLPGYRKQLSELLDTSLGKGLVSAFFFWFLLSGWFFQFLIFGVFVLPVAGPLLIGTIANKFVVEGDCPACQTQFVGWKKQTITCLSCGNIVWQPQDQQEKQQGPWGFFSRGEDSKSKSESDIIDVEYEEK